MFWVEYRACKVIQTRVLCIWMAPAAFYNEICVINVLPNSINDLYPPFFGRSYCSEWSPGSEGKLTRDCCSLGDLVVVITLLLQQGTATKKPTKSNKAIKNDLVKHKWTLKKLVSKKHCKKLFSKAKKH